MLSAMRSQPAAVLWMGLAFGLAVGFAITVLAILGVGDRGIHAALAATARVAFLFFFPAYAGGALTSLFGPRFLPLKQRGREFGLAFASALLVHLGLVVCLCLLFAPPSASVFLIFGIGAAWTYFLAIGSIDRVRQALGPTYWWWLRILGMNYIACAFILDFLKDPLKSGVRSLVEYLPFLILALAGPALWLAELARQVALKSRYFSLRT
jgi:hypothetical protein